MELAKQQDQKVKIVNVVAFKHFPKYLDLEKTAAANPGQVEYDGVVQFRCGRIKNEKNLCIMMLKGGLQVNGAHSTSEAITELEKAFKRIKWVYI